MPETLQRFKCQICATEYASLEEATQCEDQGQAEWPEGTEVGQTIRVRTETNCGSRWISSSHDALILDRLTGHVLGLVVTHEYYSGDNLDLQALDTTDTCNLRLVGIGDAGDWVSPAEYDKTCSREHYNKILLEAMETVGMDTVKIREKMAMTREEVQEQCDQVSRFRELSAQYPDKTVQEIWTMVEEGKIGGG